MHLLTHLSSTLSTPNTLLTFYASIECKVLCFKINFCIKCNKYLIVLRPFCAWWRHQMEQFPHYWPFVRGIPRWPVDSPHKGQWGGPLIFSLIFGWTNGWAHNRDAGDMRRHRVHYDATVIDPGTIADGPDLFVTLFSANHLSDNH